ncbi:unnamed protein product [Miscanthus lutarioriparius]|uniref:Uncharacterized protein n=1 Tax=Miscanthus lutarioriparius TaxID=422564 RepID=A0A811RXW6_9POAL|nr:unnamed protein product [Miscanthus lutarioriparius]
MLQTWVILCPQEIEETGVLAAAEETERHWYKSDKNMWMSKVRDKWDTLMFQQAHNWENQDLPEEVMMKLSGIPMDGAERSERSWAL